MNIKIATSPAPRSVSSQTEISGIVIMGLNNGSVRTQTKEMGGYFEYFQSLVCVLTDQTDMKMLLNNMA